MKFCAILSAAACAFVAISSPTLSVAGPEFLSYEGRNAIHEGQGGEKKTVEGIDFWSNGDPPRRYKVIGSLTDRRHETGLIGMVRMSSLDSDIARAAKAAGGDAVILAAEGDKVVGVAAESNTNVNGYASPYGGFNANANSFGFAHQIKKHDARYIVVQYLPEAAPAAIAAPAIPSPAPLTSPPAQPVQ